MPNRIRLLALSAMVVASACTSGDFVAPTVSSSDTYILHSFNGGALPAVISSDAQGEVALLDDSFEFQNGGSYLERGHLRTTRGGVVTVQTLESPGTYSRAGSAVTLVSTSGTITGSFAENKTLTIVAGTNTLIFRR